MSAAKASYSPGPWAAEWKENGPYTYCPVASVIAVNGDFTGIQCRSLSAEYHSDGGALHETRKANLRLVAAAPDLLEALCRIVAYDREPSRAESREQFKMMDAARAAIAKARGES